MFFVAAIILISPLISMVVLLLLLTANRVPIDGNYSQYLASWVLGAMLVIFGRSFLQSVYI